MQSIFSLADINNQIDRRGVYPEARGSTVAERASPLTPYTAGGYKQIPEVGLNTLTGGGRASVPSMAGYDNPQGTTAPGGAGGVSSMLGNGALGKPLTWWAILVVLLVALMWIAQRFGSEAEAFKNVRLSIYNIVVIALAAAIGFGFFKMLFGRFNVPGLSEYWEAV